MFKRGLADVGKSLPKSASNRTFDFWLNYEEMADIIFLDSYENVPFDVVHPLFFDKTQHLVACGKAAGDDCPICDYLDSLPKDATDKPYRREMAFFSVLDLRPYEKEDGTVIPVTKKLLKASKQTVGSIQQEMNMSSIEELYGTLWKVGRGKNAMPKPAAVGNSFRYLRSADLDRLVEQTGDESLVMPVAIEELDKMIIRDPETAMQTFQSFLESKGESQARKATGFSATKLNI